MNKAVKDICDALDDAESIWNACEHKRWRLVTVRYGKHKQHRKSFVKLSDPINTIEEPKR